MTDAPTAAAAPGFLAFVAFFLLALSLWFLMRNMNSRMRRMSYRQQQAHRGKNDPQAGPGERDDDRADEDGPADGQPDGGGSADGASGDGGSGGDAS